MKKLLKSVAIVLCLLFAMQSNVILAATDNISLSVNNMDIQLKNNIFMMEDQIMIPVRSFMEYYEYIVQWNGKTNEITLLKGDDEIVLKPGSSTVFKNGEVSELSRSVVSLNGVSYAPVSLIKAVADTHVIWEADLCKLSLLSDELYTSRGIGTPVSGMGTSSKEDTDNLLVNGGFENDGGSLAENWKKRREGTNVSLDTTVAHTGKNSVKVSKSDSSDIPMVAYEGFAAELAAWGTGKYKISYWVKTDASSNIIMCLFRAFAGNIDGAWSNVEMTGNQQTITAGDGWKKIERTFEITDPSKINGQAELCFGFTSATGANGNLWFDDIVLTKAD